MLEFGARKSARGVYSRQQPLVHAMKMLQRLCRRYPVENVERHLVRHTLQFSYVTAALGWLTCQPLDNPSR